MSGNGSFDPTAYKNDYNKQNYDVIRALVPKGTKAAIKDAATARGLSVSSLIVEALEAYTGLNLSK